VAIQDSASTLLHQAYDAHITNNTVAVFHESTPSTLHAAGRHKDEVVRARSTCRNQEKQHRLHRRVIIITHMVIAAHFHMGQPFQQACIHNVLLASTR
jgi:hypothetical protein